MRSFPAQEQAADWLVETAHYLAARQYHSGLSGNLTVRIGEDRVLGTRSQASKSRLKSSDLVICDLEGRKVGGAGEVTSEIGIHLASYRSRPDVRAVVHSHPPMATAFAVTRTPLNQLALPEMVVLLGPVALVPYATPGTPRLGEALAPFLPGHDAFLLENHGALTLGTDSWEAAYRMELLEHNARITWHARQLGPLYALPPEEHDRLLQVRRNLLNK